MAILLADIGGTHARFTWFKSGKITAPVCLNCDDFKNPIDLIRSVVQNQKLSGLFLSVAGPVQSGQVQWTNRPKWKLSEKQLKKVFKIQNVILINDMVAQGYGLKVRTNQKVLLANVGTGFGSCIILNGQVYPCEFGLVLDKENHKKEFLLSGKGIIRIYHALGGNKKIVSAKTLYEMRQKDKKAKKAYEKFYQLWGKTVGNIATGLMLTDVCLWGGLVPKNKKDMQDFLKTFHDKKFPTFNQKISVTVIKEKSLAINGLANLSTKK